MLVYTDVYYETIVQLRSFIVLDVNAWVKQ